MIPKGVREKFGLTSCQRLIVLTDDKEGIALIPSEIFEANLRRMMKYAMTSSEIYS